METRLNLIAPLNLADALINIYVNLLTNSPAFSHKSGVMIDCKNPVMVRYQQQCSRSQVCTAYIGSSQADTVCGVCYKTNNVDNPIYAIKIDQLNFEDEQFVKLAIVYMINKLRIDELTHTDTFRMLLHVLYTLSNAISELMASDLKTEFITHDMKESFIKFVDNVPNTVYIFKNYIYELVNDILSRNTFIVTQLIRMQLLYKDLFLKYNIDNQQDEPLYTMDTYELPWTTRDKMYGIKLADDYWDKMDLQTLINTTSLVYAAPEVSIIIPQTNYIIYLLLLIVIVVLVYRKYITKVNITNNNMNNAGI